jgi:hypothetical protein
MIEPREEDRNRDDLNLDRASPSYARPDFLFMLGPSRREMRQLGLNDRLPSSEGEELRRGEHSWDKLAGSSVNEYDPAGGDSLHGG